MMILQTLNVSLPRLLPPKVTLLIDRRASSLFALASEAQNVRSGFSVLSDFNPMITFQFSAFPFFPVNALTFT